MTEQLKGKYVLDRLLGCGGMAEVFVGRALGAAGFSRQVAIKRIHRGYSAHAQFRQMFEAEARLSSRLRHSNVVSVLDFDEDEAGCLFLVMEYVDGVDLDGLLGTGLLPLPVVVFITSEILRGLAYVHELPLLEGGPLGLVHRDVSPQNVLLSWDGAVQVSDFGIAKARTATLAGASLSLKGKPAYMSPEQARGRSLDGRSDTFAAGVMLWEMLCGRHLFHDPNDMAATLAAVMFSDPPPPSSRAPRPIPDDLERVTMALLRRDRDDRPDAATALAALAACADYPRSGREDL
ncbi:MAG TPA: serine/threonine-protein kinase, partial [Kofleriaceae bacterium]|nr:serine/threonine-protein kinase [Kofleriaceae bacterium]